MLRITEHDSSTDGLTLRLEGRLSGSNVDELRRVCETTARRRPLSLDLSGLTWLDEAGVAAIRELLDRKATVSRCKPFIWHLLRRPQP